MLRFFENFDLGETVLKRKKYWTFFWKISKIFKILKIRDSSFVALLILRHFISINWSLLLKLHQWRRFPWTHFAGQNRRNMTSLWRHSRLTYYDLGPIFLHKVWNCCPEGYGKFQSEISSTSGAICEKPQGALWAPPPPPAGRGLITSLFVSEEPCLNVLHCAGSLVEWWLS